MPLPFVGGICYLGLLRAQEVVLAAMLSHRMEDSPCLFTPLQLANLALLFFIEKYHKEKKR
ncbi:MAG: hypothetical protein Q4E87_07170 [bacterium]|nr:hypothetical protein [bacterium]